MMVCQHLVRQILIVGIFLLARDVSCQSIDDILDREVESFATGKFDEELAGLPDYLGNLKAYRVCNRKIDSLSTLLLQNTLKACESCPKSVCTHFKLLTQLCVNGTYDDLRKEFTDLFNQGDHIKKNSCGMESPDFYYSTQRAIMNYKDTLWSIQEWFLDLKTRTQVFHEYLDLGTFQDVYMKKVQPWISDCCASKYLKYNETEGVRSPLDSMIFESGVDLKTMLSNNSTSPLVLSSYAEGTTYEQIIRSDLEIFRQITIVNNQIEVTETITFPASNSLCKKNGMVIPCKVLWSNTKP